MEFLPSYNSGSDTDEGEEKLKESPSSNVLPIEDEEIIDPTQITIPNSILSKWANINDDSDDEDEEEVVASVKLKQPKIIKDIRKETLSSTNSSLVSLFDVDSEAPSFLKSKTKKDYLISSVVNHTYNDKKSNEVVTFEKKSGQSRTEIDEVFHPEKSVPLPKKTEKLKDLKKRQPDESAKVYLSKI